MKQNFYFVHACTWYLPQSFPSLLTPLPESQVSCFSSNEIFYDYRDKSSGSHALLIEFSE